MTDREGYCKHGVYVGGCGIDWMCPHCEAGTEPETDDDFHDWLWDTPATFTPAELAAHYLEYKATGGGELQPTPSKAPEPDDDCGCYQATFTAAELGIVATALEHYIDSSAIVHDYGPDELTDAIATAREAHSEVTHLIGGNPQ